MIYPKPDPRWAPFQSIQDDTVVTSDKDLFVGSRRKAIIQQPQDAGGPRKLHDLFVFGQMRIHSKHATLIFRTVYVFGTLELDGIKLLAARVVFMTKEQFLRGLAAVQNEPVANPVDLDSSDTIRLSRTGKKSVIKGDMNKSLYGMTGLMWAISCKDEQLVKLFIYAKADLEMKYGQWTALAWAAIKRHTPITEMLFKAGANPNAALEELQENHRAAFAHLRAVLSKYPSIPVHQTTHTPQAILFEDRPLPSQPKLDLTALDLENSTFETRLAIYKIAIALDKRHTPLTSAEFSHLREKMLNKTFMLKHCLDPQMINVFLFVNRQVQRLTLPTDEIRS